MSIKEKSSYCLSCKSKNCMKGCPLSNDITDAIKYVKEENYDMAYNKFIETTVLSSICGRVCPHTKQCQGSCIRGIKGDPVDIGSIETFIGDYGIEKNIKIPNFNEYKKIEKSVAVIGSGPCGITCAATLKRLGVSKVTLFEKKNYLGGLLVHGIPEFRLPKEIVNKVYNKIITDLDVEVKLEKELGKDFSIDSLKQEYDSIFIAIGANTSSKMGIPGEDLNGVYGGNELLEYKNFPDFKDKKVVVSGGGNVAMDTARTIKKLGADKVYVVYRRAEEQMPAEKKEIKEAKNEGIEFIFLNNIVRIIGKDNVEKIECIKTKLVEKPGERPYPVNIDGSNYTIDTDYVVMAIGSKLNEDILPELKRNDWGKIQIDKCYRTNVKGVYAAGDFAGIKSTVAFASNSGKEAAKSIYNDLTAK